MNNALAGQKNLTLTAQWEIKTDKRIVREATKNRLAELRRQHHANLEQRRERLAALLAAEDRLYEHEFNEKQETPEQVRQQMYERLQHLKAEREEERQALVQRKLDQRFKMQNDALRKEDSKFYIMGTQVEREKQLIDKRRQIEQRMLEEQVYAQLYSLDAQKKVEREIAEAKEKQKLQADTLAVLEWQKQAKETQRATEKQQVQVERAMLQTQWQNEEARERNIENERQVLIRERNLGLIQHNQQEKLLREQAELAEKQRDLQLLNAALEREKALEQLEHDERMRHRQETIELQKYAQQVSSDKKAYEEMIDRYVAEENAKQWDAREKQWDREDQARINLLRNVYASREQDIELKKQRAQNEQWQKQFEKANLEEEVQRQNQAYEDQMVKTSMMKKMHQTDLLRQVGERDRTMRRELQEAMYEERAARLAELEYQRRIQTEKDNNAQLLSTWKSTVNQH